MTDLGDCGYVTCCRDYTLQVTRDNNMFEFFCWPNVCGASALQSKNTFTNGENDIVIEVRFFVDKYK